MSDTNETKTLSSESPTEATPETAKSGGEPPTTSALPNEPEKPKCSDEDIANGKCKP